MDTPEPISPELALVDPELARLKKRRLPDDRVTRSTERVQASTLNAVSRQHDSAAPSSHSLQRRVALVAAVRAAAAVASAGLLLLVAGGRESQMSELVASPDDERDPRSSATKTESARWYRRPATRDTRALPDEGAPEENAPRRLHRTKPLMKSVDQSVAVLDRYPPRANVERRLLNLLVVSPVDRLPAALIDEKTGIAKNNLQAVCRRHATSFACTVAAADPRLGESLVVEYKRDREGRLAFVWPSRR